MRMGVVMKYLLLAGAFLGVIGYAWMSSGDPNVYPMSQADVYAKLRAAPIQKGNNGVFGNLEASVSGNGDSKVYWNAGGTFSSNHCEAEIAPEGASKSRIMAFCEGGGASDGAAAGMLMGMHRRALIEHIDAALNDRPFDKRLALGGTAARWPSDARQPDGSYGTMVGEALKMERDMSKMQRDSAKDTNGQDAQDLTAATRYQSTRPMVDLSR
ncbi:hypothetical protein [Sphingomonas sp.]|uniref:hypothetical protein n=1 Tax=Sphingomonas sp. TaxID=28214 RepID=UPI00286B4D42|nr:hypothetical protein [Sphingomonas sp.]